MTQQSKDEWGPWIDHDGMRCPVIGSYVNIVTVNNFASERNYCLFAGSEGGSSWDWTNAPKFTRVTRYRIRKPRGMAALEAIARNVPEYISAKETP